MSNMDSVALAQKSSSEKIVSELSGKDKADILTRRVSAAKKHKLSSPNRETPVKKSYTANGQTSSQTNTSNLGKTHLNNAPTVATEPLPTTSNPSSSTANNNNSSTTGASNSLSPMQTPRRTTAKLSRLYFHLDSSQPTPPPSILHQQQTRKNVHQIPDVKSPKLISNTQLQTPHKGGEKIQDQISDNNAPILRRTRNSPNRLTQSQQTQNQKLLSKQNSSEQKSSVTSNTLNNRRLVTDEFSGSPKPPSTKIISMASSSPSKISKSSPTKTSTGFVLTKSNRKRIVISNLFDQRQVQSSPIESKTKVTIPQNEPKDRVSNVVTRLQKQDETKSCGCNAKKENTKSPSPSRKLTISTKKISTQSEAKSQKTPPPESPLSGKNESKLVEISKQKKIMISDSLQSNDNQDPFVQPRTEKIRIASSQSNIQKSPKTSTLSSKKKLLTFVKDEKQLENITNNTLEISGSTTESKIHTAELEEPSTMDIIHNDQIDNDIFVDAQEFTPNQDLVNVSKIIKELRNNKESVNDENIILDSSPIRLEAPKRKLEAPKINTLFSASKSTESPESKIVNHKTALLSDLNSSPIRDTPFRETLKKNNNTKDILKNINTPVRKQVIFSSDVESPSILSSPLRSSFEPKSILKQRQHDLSSSPSKETDSYNKQLYINLSQNESWSSGQIIQLSPKSVQTDSVLTQCIQALLTKGFVKRFECYATIHYILKNNSVQFLSPILFEYSKKLVNIIIVDNSITKTGQLVDLSDAFQSRLTTVSIKVLSLLSSHPKEYNIEDTEIHRALRYISFLLQNESLPKSVCSAVLQVIKDHKSIDTPLPNPIIESILQSLLVVQNFSSFTITVEIVSILADFINKYKGIMTKHSTRWMSFLLSTFLEYGSIPSAQRIVRAISFAIQQTVNCVAITGKSKISFHNIMKLAGSDNDNSEVSLIDAVLEVLTSYLKLDFYTGITIWLNLTYLQNHQFPLDHVQRWISVILPYFDNDDIMIKKSCLFAFKSILYELHSDIFFNSKDIELRDEIFKILIIPFKKTCNIKELEQIYVQLLTNFYEFLNIKNLKCYDNKELEKINEDNDNMDSDRSDHSDQNVDTEKEDKDKLYLNLPIFEPLKYNIKEKCDDIILPFIENIIKGEVSKGSHFNIFEPSELIEYIHPQPHYPKNGLINLLPLTKLENVFEIFNYFVRTTTNEETIKDMFTVLIETFNNPGIEKDPRFRKCFQLLCDFVQEKKLLLDFIQDRFVEISGEFELNELFENDKDNKNDNSIVCNMSNIVYGPLSSEIRTNFKNDFFKLVKKRRITLYFELIKTGSKTTLLSPVLLHEPFTKDQYKLDRDAIRLGLKTVPISMFIQFLVLKKDNISLIDELEPEDWHIGNIKFLGESLVTLKSKVSIMYKDRADTMRKKIDKLFDELLLKLKTAALKSFNNGNGENINNNNDYKKFIYFSSFGHSKYNSGANGNRDSSGNLIYLGSDKSICSTESFETDSSKSSSSLASTGSKKKSKKNEKSSASSKNKSLKNENKNGKVKIECDSSADTQKIENSSKESDESSINLNSDANISSVTAHSQEGSTLVIDSISPLPSLSSLSSSKSDAFDSLDVKDTQIIDDSSLRSQTTSSGSTTKIINSSLDEGNVEIKDKKLNNSGSNSEPEDSSTHIFPDAQNIVDNVAPIDYDSVDSSSSSEVKEDTNSLKRKAKFDIENDINKKLKLETTTSTPDIIKNCQSSATESSIAGASESEIKEINHEESTKVQKSTEDKEPEVNAQQLIIKKHDQVSDRTPIELPQQPQQPANFPPGYLPGFQPQNMFPVNYPYPYTPEQFQFPFPNPYTNFPYPPYQFAPHPANIGLGYSVQPNSDKQAPQQLQANQIRNHFANMTLDRLIHDKDLSIWNTLDKVCTAAQKNDADIEMSKTDRTALEEKLIDLVVKLRKTN